MVEGFVSYVQVCLYYTFSYTTFLALQYRDRVQRTQAAQDHAEENDILIRGRVPDRYRALLGQISLVGTRDPTLICYPP